ncbi:MAG: hypothetical protein Q7Q71_01725 [Verrucomicrobiota bacterium JB023]|nr:hypothetical protein [Verrucomicrobiota bacterium JB023]
MSLRQQLNDSLIEILPVDPSEAIKGTELIRLVRMRLDGDYSDASLRYHFSIMSCDPASPIAKVEKGQGYYRRAPAVPDLIKAREMMAQGQLDEVGSDPRALDYAVSRIQKFRAVVTRYSEAHQRFPFQFRQSLGKGAPIGNLWKIPDMVIVDWESGEPDEAGFQLDRTNIMLRRSLGLAPYRLDAVSLKLAPNLELHREDFFQALAVSAWCNSGELYYANSIADEALADALRHLASIHGVGVTTFGLSLQSLDELPPAEHILNAQPRETEALMERLDVRRIAPSRRRDHLDWASLQNLRMENPEVHELFVWIAKSLDANRIEPQSYE